MLLSDISVKRPVFATVVNLLLVTFGILAFYQLPLREYPDVNAPVVSISTDYRGAAAVIVETKITQVLEDLVSGIEGIKHIDSSSSDGKSRINIEFKLSRDIDSAANDVRERIARALDDLPEESDPPEIYKADSNTSVIMWLNLSSPSLNSLELSDYAERYLQDQFAIVDGVARVRIGGGGRYAMRIWLNSLALAARQLTITDIENALRRENVELPAGRIESKDREFTIRIARSYRDADDFAQLVLTRQADGSVIRLGDVARVELGQDDYRRELRGNGEPMIGIGIIKQSTANTLAVARAVKREAVKVRQQLPEYIELHDSYDTSVFIEGAIEEVYRTLFIAMILVVAVILIFLGSLRATLVPAVTVPISLISAFIVISALGFSVNLLTLLALVLAIGLVVDDAIVVLENIYRRIEQGEPPLLASYHGARQVSFAVIVTTLVLIAVFVPIAFLQGNVGRLFAEFALTMAAAVGFSSIVALSLSPMMCSVLFKQNLRKTFIHRLIDRFFQGLATFYAKLLNIALKVSFLIILLLIGVGFGIYYVFQQLPSEFAPKEDRGAFFIMMTAPEGASFSYSQRYMAEIEKTMLRYVENGEATRALARVPRSFGSSAVVNSGIGIMVLSNWDKRRPAEEIMGEIMGDMKQLVGVKAFTVMRRGLGQRGIQRPVQFVIGGGRYEELAQWRDIILEQARQNPNLISVDADYKETKPQLMLVIDKDRAADLGVSIREIGSSLETLLGSRRVTTFLRQGEEYDVVLEGEDQDYRTPADLASIYVRAEQTGLLVPLSNLVTLQETATSTSLQRYNRIRAITITAGLAEGYSLSEALDFLGNIVKQEMPQARIDYKGQSADFQDSTQSVNFTFILALLVVFLVLAAQFESFIHPLVIMLTVPLAIFGALLGLDIMGQSINIYSQIGIVMLIGLATKNGILIVEFTNQLRDAGHEFKEALLQASQQRLRPILMTAITTIMGAVPLILAQGAGSESRVVIGVVIFSGVAFSTFFTLFVVPVAYWLLARHTQSPNAIARKLEALEALEHHK
ncbi:efflux RND transporter permease subunit [Candidatus Albibeggiatoa sp. nov. BB20]|uniref:efflux RND transporter permease subunit n=1 Tax=Candidatus Albibeggiatoa sp. nov. BB20 TaxID=3162723 RepID=UPI0033658BF0